MADNFGAVNAADAGTLALLYGGGFGRGIGVGYGGGYGYGIANPTATYVQNDAISARVADQADCTRGMIASNTESDRIAVAELARNMADDVTRAEMGTGFANLQQSHLQSTIMDGQTALGNERRQSDLFMNLNNKLQDMARDQAQCCCDIKLEIADKHAASDALVNQRFFDLSKQIDANDKAAILRDLDRAERRNQTLELEAYIGKNGQPAPANCL